MKYFRLTVINLFFLAGMFVAGKSSAEIFVPSLKDGFYLGASGYYIKPAFTNGDLDYASVNTSPTISEIKNNNLGYQLGWGVLVGYIFPQSGNDTTLSYFHLNGDHTNSVSVASEVITPVAFTSPLIGSVDQANSKISMNLNRVDWTFGQFINVCPNLQIHSTGGLRYLNLDRNLSDYYVNTPASNIMTVVEDSSLDAIGLLGGLDANYALGYGFSARSYFDADVLIGRINARLDAAEGSIPLDPMNDTTWTIKSDNFLIMPGFDLKLAVDYRFPLHRLCSNLTLEAGYQVSDYFNVIDRVGGIGNITNVAVSNHRTANLEINGPYISVLYGM